MFSFKLLTFDNERKFIFKSKPLDDLLFYHCLFEPRVLYRFDSRFKIRNKLFKFENEYQSDVVVGCDFYGGFTIHDVS